MWVIVHIEMSHDTHINVSRGAHRNDSLYPQEWVMAHCYTVKYNFSEKKSHTWSREIRSGHTSANTLQHSLQHTATHTATQIHITGLFWHVIGLLWHVLELLWHVLELFWHITALWWHIIGHLWAHYRQDRRPFGQIAGLFWHVAGLFSWKWSSFGQS